MRAARTNACRTGEDGEGVHFSLRREVNDGSAPDRAASSILESRRTTMLQRVMTNEHVSLAELSDDDLLIELRRSVAVDRVATARVIEVLAEVDARRLYLGEGCSSLFTYCTQVLRLSEHAAYGRIAAARLARRVPDVLEALRAGEVTLTSACLIGPHLTPANCGELLASVRYKSKREVEQFVAAFAPKPDGAASVRKLPARTQLAPRQATGASPRPRAGMGSDELRPETVRASLQRALNAEGVIPKPSAACLEEAGRSSELRTPAVASESTLPAGINGADAALPRSAADARPRPAVVAPLAPERYKVQFTASRELHDKLRRAQDLLRHTVPDGDVAVVFDRALTLLVEDLERRKLAATTGPRAGQSLTSESRYIPAAVKRSVWSRDEGQCTFVGTRGRCTERGFLEFHHLVPFAAGGETSAGNLTLRCRAHNQFEAERFFGPLLAREEGVDYGEWTWSGPSSIAARRRCASSTC
jgi:hypothetical protein